MVFKLVRVDTADPCKIQLPAGTHLFGRKVFLDCDDKRVSRSHGQLEVTADTVVLKALHQNPCFYKRKATDETMTLKQHCIADLSHGDKFGLLPTSFWYELLLCPDIANDAQDNVPNAQEHRAANPAESTQDIDMEAIASDTITNGNDDQELDKDDQDLLDFDMNETVGNVDRAESPSLIPEQQQPATSSSDDQQPAAVTSAAAKPPSPQRTPSPEPATSSKRAHLSDDAGYDVETPKKVKTEPEDDAGTSDGNGQAGPSSTDAAKVKTEPPSSPAKPPQNAPAARERCMYGARCYRKNPQHKAQYSHPQDPDWGADARIQCPYGAQCHKRDPRHHRDHDHPPVTLPPHQAFQPAAQPGQAHKTLRRRESRSDSSREVSPNPDTQLLAKRPRKAAKRQSWSGSGSCNEYDMEDPFLTDGSGSGDEWRPQSSDLTTQSQSQDL